MHTRRLVAALAAIVGLAALAAVLVPTLTPASSPAVVLGVTGLGEAEAVATNPQHYCLRSQAGWPHRYEGRSGENQNSSRVGAVYSTTGAILWTFNLNDPSYINGYRMWGVSNPDAWDRQPSYYASWYGNYQGVTYGYPVYRGICSTNSWGK